MTLIQLLSRLARHWPIILLVTNSIFVVLGIFIFRQLRKARKGAGGRVTEAAQKEKGSAEVEAEIVPPSGLPSVRQIRRTVRSGFRLLRERVTSRNLRYRTPLFLLIGPEGAGKSAMLRELMPEAVAPLDSTEAHGCRWHFFDRAVTIEVDGRLLHSEERGASANGWTALHRALRRHRPERPIDGLVLTIPVTDLIGPQRLDRDALVLRARAFFQRLHTAQRILGVRVPLYLVVSKCDLLQGFPELCAAVPPEKQGESFGWANPYALESVFAPEWVDEAFDSLSSDLFQLQLELLTRGAAADPSEIFQFSNAFRAVQEPLRDFATELCRESAYQESFFFRGIYFTGDGTLDPAERMLAADALRNESGEYIALPPLPETLAVSRRPFFLTDLFGQKIFGETGLARAVGQAKLTRNRAILAMQVAMLAIVLLGGVGIWRANVVLQRENGLLLSVLADIRSDLRFLDSRRERLGADRNGDWSTALNDRVFPLLSSMARVNENRLSSFFLPSSWASSLHWDISESMRQGFTHVILPSMYSAMLAKADSLAQPVRPGAGLAAANSAELTGYLSAVGRYGRNLERYDTVSFIGAKDTELDNMAELVLYLFDEDLPPEFLENKRYHRMALWESYGQRITPRDRPHFTYDAVRRAEQLLRDYYDALIIRLEEINTRFQSAESVYRLSAADLADFRQLRDDLAQIGRVLDGSESFWFEEGEAIGPSLLAILDSIPTTPLTSGPRFREEFIEIFQRVRREKLQDLNRRLDPFREGSSSGSMEAALQLSPHLATLQSALDTLFSQPFLAAAPAGSARALPPPGSAIRWDVPALDRALQDHMHFAAFFAEGQPGESPGMDRLLRGLGTVQLEARLTDALYRAMLPDPPGYAFGLQDRERDLRNRITAFQEPSRRLVQLLGIADELGMNEMYDQFGAIYLEQALGMLAEVDALLEEGASYRPLGGSLASWEVGEPAVLAAFRVRDEEELERYLAEQRSRVRYLVDGFAAPLLGGLSSNALAPYLNVSGGGSGLVGKWSGLVAELDRYETRSGTSSVEALEHFIREEMTSTDLMECVAASEQRGTSGGDFFLLARNRLRSQLHTRCRQLALGRARDGYDRLQRYFNANLSGRFPFTSDPASGTQEADVESVRHFFTLYDEVGAYRPVIGSTSAATFLAQMEEVRGFLDPLLRAEYAPGGPLFQVGIAFRANRSEERGADQVVDWMLTLGEESVRYRGGEPEHSLWRPGSPASLSLRWALHSAERPIGDGYTAVSIADRDALFRFSGRWALLRMIESHRIADPSGEPGHLLRFQVPTARVIGDGSSAAPGAGAQLFVRLRLTDPEGGALLRVPTFPVQAPNFAF